MPHYAMIVGTNGYKYSAPSNCSLGNKIKDFNSKKKTITSVAVGGSYKYAICCDDGAASFNGPSGFESKMYEIDCSKIKHISFGPDDQWAITMKSGWCYYSLWTTKTNCSKRIEEHNGSIKYVSLCKHDYDWIVGYGNNGYANGGGVCSELTSFLSGINASKKSINLVELGSSNHWFVDHENGRKWSMDKELSDWYQYETSNYCSTVSLW